MSLRISINQRSLVDGREPIVVEYGEGVEATVMLCGSVELEGPARLVWDRRSSRSRARAAHAHRARVWLITDSPVVVRVAGEAYRIPADGGEPERIEP